MNHYDRRGSWAGGWGRQVSRYRDRLPGRLVGFAPQHVRSARGAAWQVERDFGSVGGGPMGVGSRAGVEFAGPTRAQGYRVPDRWMHGKSGSGGQRTARGGSLVHWRSRLSAVRGWKPPRMTIVGTFVRQARAGIRLNGLMIAHRAGRLQGDARAKRMESAPGSLGYQALAPIRLHGNEIGGLAGAMKQRLAYPSAVPAGRDHFPTGDQWRGGQAQMWRGRGAGELSPGSTEHRPSAASGAKYRVMDHDMMGWLGRAFGDEARRPPSGPTRCDGLLAPIYPGRKPGF